MNENDNLDDLQQLPVDEAEVGLCVRTCGGLTCQFTEANQ